MDRIGLRQMRRAGNKYKVQRIKQQRHTATKRPKISMC